MNDLVAEANVSTGEFIHRPMTETEIEADEVNRAEVAAQKEAEEIAQAEKNLARLALLEKLGISEEEAKLLLS